VSIRSLSKLQELLGHADVSTTLIYTHVLNKGARGVRAQSAGRDVSEELRARWGAPKPSVTTGVIWPRAVAAINFPPTASCPRLNLRATKVETPLRHFSGDGADPLQGWPGTAPSAASGTSTARLQLIDLGKLLLEQYQQGAGVLDG